MLETGKSQGPQLRGRGWFYVIINSCDGGLAEEAVFVVHQVLVDAGPER